MVAAMKLDKVVDLEAYRAKRFNYKIGIGLESPRPGQPGYVGRYTFPAPCDVQEENGNDAEKG